MIFSAKVKGRVRKFHSHSISFLNPNLKFQPPLPPPPPLISDKSLSWLLNVVFIGCSWHSAFNTGFLLAKITFFAHFALNST